MFQKKLTHGTLHIFLQLQLGEGLITHHENQLITVCYAGPQNWWALVNTVMNLWVP